MQDNSIKDFKILLDSICNLTNQASIEWVRINPTTYSWSSDKGRTTIQLIEDKRVVFEGGKLVNKATKSYIFQAHDEKDNLRVRLNSQEMTQISDNLAKLYNVALESAALKGLDFLKHLLSK